MNAHVTVGRFKRPKLAVTVSALALVESVSAVHLHKEAEDTLRHVQVHITPGGIVFSPEEKLEALRTWVREHLRLCVRVFQGGLKINVHENVYKFYDRADIPVSCMSRGYDENDESPADRRVNMYTLMGAQVLALEDSHGVHGVLARALIWPIAPNLWAIDRIYTTCAGGDYILLAYARQRGWARTDRMGEAQRSKLFPYPPEYNDNHCPYLDSAFAERNGVRVYYKYLTTDTGDNDDDDFITHVRGRPIRRVRRVREKDWR